QIETPEGQSLAYTRGKADQVVAALRAIDGVDYTYTTVGSGGTGTVTRGDIYVKLDPMNERSQSQQELMVVARDRLKDLYGVRTSVLEAGGLGGAQAPLQVEIRGPDAVELQRIGEQVKATVEQVPGVVDVRTSVGAPK